MCLNLFKSRMHTVFSDKHFAFDDFCLLGEEIGLTRDYTLWLTLGQFGNPTDLITTKFYYAQEGSCVRKFWRILEGMKRSDVVDVIDEWVMFECYE